MQGNQNQSRGINSPVGKSSTFKWCRFVTPIVVAAWAGIVAVPDTAFAFQQEDEPAAIALYNTAANLYGDQQYELAIAQWNQLLKDHPGYSRRRDTLYFTGVAHYNLKQFENAIDFFTSLRDSLPNLKDYRRSDKMLFYLAYCQFEVARQQGPDGSTAFKGSLATWKQFFDKFADSDLASEAAFFQGETFRQLNQVDADANTLDQAAESYRRVADDEDSNRRSRALYLYGVCREDSGEYRDAAAVYLSYLTDFSDGDSADKARLGRADCLMQLGIASKNTGNRVESQDLFTEASELYEIVTDKTDFELRALATYQHAYCLAHLGDYENAADRYATISTDYPEFEFADDSTLEAGKFYFTAGKFDDAEKWLQKVVDSQPSGQAEASHWLCRIKLENKQFADALQIANRALAADPSNHEVNLRMDAADALDGIPDRRREAIQAFEEIAAEFAQHAVAPKALYYAAFGYMTEGQHANAIKTAEQFRKLYSDHELLPDTLEVLGQSAMKENELSLAETTFKNLASRFPDNPRHDWWQTRIGWASFLQGNYDDAIGWLSQALTEMKDTASKSEARYVIGSSQFELKNYPKSIESLEQTLVDNPDRSNAGEVRLLTARAWSNLNESAKAIGLAQRVWDDTSTARAAYWLGEFTYQSGEFTQSVQHYRDALKQDDESIRPDVLYGLAWAHSSAGDPTRSLAAFNDLVEKYPNHTLANDALIGRGKALRIAGQFPEAIADLNKFLQSGAGPKALFNGTFERALCQVGLKKWDLAIADLEGLTDRLAQHPDLADDILFELAWAYKENQQNEDASATFLKLASDHPSSPNAAEANYHVGQRLYDNNEFGDAVTRYRLCLKGKPDKRVGELAAYKLAWCLFKQDHYAEAVEAFEYQCTEYPQGELRAVGLSMVAESYFQLDKHSEAVTAYKVAIPAIKSSDVKSNVRVLAPIHAAQSANKVKEHEAALGYAQIIVNDHADSPYLAEAWYEIGVAHKGLGQREKAVEAWTSAMKESLGKTGARARCMVAEELFTDKKFDDAINQFKLVIYGYGGRDSADDVKPWQAFAAYEAARCNYVQVGETDDAERKQALIKNARELFQMLVDNFPNDRLASDARKQIRVLDSLK